MPAEKVCRVWLLLLIPVSWPAAVFDSSRDLLVGEGEVGAELGLIGERTSAGGAGPVVGAGASDFELEVGNDGELAVRAVDAKTDQAGEDLVAIDRGVGAVLDDEARVDAEVNRAGSGIDDVAAEGAAEGREASALRGGRAVAHAQAGVVAGAEHGVGREVGGTARIARVCRSGALLGRIVRPLLRNLRGRVRRRGVGRRWWGIVLRGRRHCGNQ